MQAACVFLIWLLPVLPAVAADLEELRAECRKLYVKKEYNKVALLIARSREARKDAELQTIFATAKLKAGNVAAARKAYERLLKRHPSLWVAANNLGVVYYRQKNYARAMLHFVLAAKRQPDSQLIINNLAEVYRAYRMSDPPRRPLSNVAKAIEALECLEGGLADKKKMQGLVRWGIEWVTPEQRTEYEKIRLETKMEIERTEKQLTYARYDLAKAEESIAYWGRKMHAGRMTGATGGRGPRLGTSGVRSDLRGKRPVEYLNEARADKRAYEMKIAETTRLLDGLRAQLPVPPYNDTCELIEISADWSLLSSERATVEHNHAK